MKLSRLFFLFLFISLYTAARAQQTPSARQVIHQFIAAMGGMEYLTTVKTLYTDIETEMEGRPVHWVTKEMLPNKGSFEIVYNNRVVYRNWYDGSKGYELVGGEKKAADPEEFRDKAFKKNIFNAIDYLDTTLWKLESAGEERAGGEDCYKIKATLSNGRVSYLYFSKASYYLLREDKVSDKEKGAFSTVLFSDYKKFGRLIHYTRMQFGQDGDFQTGRIVQLKANENISDKDFQ